jgi:hypothetical protein
MLVGQAEGVSIRTRISCGATVPQVDANGCWQRVIDLAVLTSFPTPPSISLSPAATLARRGD